jgi:hypothetical protein
MNYKSKRKKSVFNLIAKCHLATVLQIQDDPVRTGDRLRRTLPQILNVGKRREMSPILSRRRKNAISTFGFLHDRRDLWQRSFATTDEVKNDEKLKTSKNKNCLIIIVLSSLTFASLVGES